MHFRALLTCVLLLATLASGDNTASHTTTNLTQRTSVVILADTSSIFASPSSLHSPLLPGVTTGTTLPLSLPSWELKNRAHWLKVASGHPLPPLPLPPLTTPPPSLPKRQVPIPYVPSDWTMRVECPVIQGVPCVTVSEYLPWLKAAAEEAAQEAARASESVKSSVENGAWVPGMPGVDVPASGGEREKVDKVIGGWGGYMGARVLAVVCMAMIYAVLVL